MSVIILSFLREICQKWWALGSDKLRMVMHENCQADFEKAPRRSSLVHPSCEKYFPIKFHYFGEICQRTCALRLENLWPIFHKKCQRGPGKASQYSQDYYTVLWRKIIFGQFSLFFRDFFFLSFRNSASLVVDIVMSPRAHILGNPIDMIRKGTHWSL